jgi:hypothetical protein
MSRFVGLSLVLFGCWTGDAQRPPPAQPQTAQAEPAKIPVKDVVQPVAVEPDPPAQPPPPPPPPSTWTPPPSPPINIPPTLLEGQRLAGNKNIVPDDPTKTAIAQSGKDKLVGSFKLCITDAGDIASITMLKSTGFAAYDNRIQTEMKLWRYSPYVVNGKQVPVCTAVTFIYSQTSPPPPPPRP